VKKDDKKKLWGKKLLLILMLIILFFSLCVLIYSYHNKQTLEYNLISGPILNPLMGFAPWATVKESKQPHTLVYADLTWRDFEPLEGFYDFESFEKKQQLERWRTEGKRVVFRFIADKPGDNVHMDIPDWLYKKINGSGDHYDNKYGKGFSPDYSNLLFISYHEKAVKALGDRYAQDDLFAYIELGSLGHWGEWHLKFDSGIRQMPPEDIRDLYVMHYVGSFPNTHLLMRRPFSIAEQLNLGLYNDMTADFDATKKWLDWIENGGECSQTHEMNALSPMPNGWLKAPIGGEQAGSMSFEEIYDTYLDQTIQLLEDSHATFIGPGSPYKLESGGPLQDGIDQVLATIGYRLYIKQVQIPLWVHFGKNIKIRLNFGNNGVAPMYYNWPCVIYLCDENGNVLINYQLEMDLRKVIPGELYNFIFVMPVDKLENGKYSIGIALIDPMTGQPAVKFAMENTRQDLIQELGSFEISRFHN